MPSVKGYLDPGSAKDSALAIFDEWNVLSALCWCNADSVTIFAGSVAQWPASVLWEKPQIYPKSKGNPNQLIDLAVAGADARSYLRWCCGVAASRAVRPREWKGTIAKPVHHMRLWPLLSPAERALFPYDTWAYIQENAHTIAMGGDPSYSAAVVDLLDATALGCYDLGRLPGPLAGKVQALKAARQSNYSPKGKRRYGNSGR